METSLLWSIILVLALVGLNGFFVAVEFALVRSHPTKLKLTEYKSLFGVKSSLKLIEELDFSLSATQLGITIASLLLGWWGEATFQSVFYSGLAWMGGLSIMGEWSALIISHAVATILALSLITFLHVVLGEVVAKSVAIRFPETTLRMLAGPMVLFNVLFRPLIYFLTACANATLALFGIKSPPESERTHSLAELSMLVSHSGEKGILDKVEEEMLQSVFSFSDTVAREIMTPRTDLVTVPIDASIEEVVQVIVSSGYSRFPVVGDSVDDIQGVIMSRDLLPYVHNLKNLPEREFSLKRIMREPYFVPGTKQISDLLNEFKRRKLHIAVVLDEHGGVDGVVTLEDVIEEIVGDIFDESDVVERDIIVEENGNVVVDGGVLVADINDRLEFSIPEGDYDTIAGFIYTSLGRLPRPGDEIVIRDSGNLEINGKLIEEALETSEESAPLAQITVEKVSGRRIERVKLQKLLSESLTNSEASEEAKEVRS